MDIIIGGYHHWCLRLYFQSFLNIQPEMSSQNKWLISSFQKKKEKKFKKNLKKKIPTDLPYLFFCVRNAILCVFLI